jgi:glutamate dehydrogenase
MRAIEEGTSAEDHARRVIAQADAILAARSGEQGFVARLFGRAAPEDIALYDSHELAEFAAGTWALLSRRKPQTATIRVASPTVRPAPTGGTRLQRVSAVEIVNDDMPFLLDSVMGELTGQGLDIHLVAHPVFGVARDAAGALTTLAEPASGPRESVIHIHVDRIDDAARRDAIAAALGEVLAEVRLAVDDWRAMLDRTGAVITDLKANPPPLDVAEIAEAVQFLEWLTAENFTFLGVRDYAFDARTNILAPRAGSSLGILRDPRKDPLKPDGGELEISPEGQALLKEPNALVIAKANARSRVHRRVAMDQVGVKRYDADGELRGVFSIVGLFTSTAYTRSTRSIPYLRRKVAGVVERAGFDPDSHSGKSLVNVLETYPRDELFQIDEDTLFRFSMEILRLDERPRVRVLPRRDRFDRFVSVLVYVPRERYTSAARRDIADLLVARYGGQAANFAPFFTEGPLVRVHFVITRKDGAMADPPRAELERAVSHIVRTWEDALDDALTAAHAPVRTRALLARYRAAFPAPYRDTFNAEAAVADIQVIEGLSQNRPLGVKFYRAEKERDEGDASVRLKVWSYDRPIPLSDRVPVLEHMAFKVVDESTFHVQARGEKAPDFWLHDMALDRIGGGAIDLAVLKDRLEACFIMTMRGLIEDDGYNALVLAAGLPWRDVALVRAFSRYLRQVRLPYSQDYMWATLVKHAAIAAKIVDLFHLRFDPRLDLTREARADRQAALAAEIEAALGDVQSLDEDRIVRHFVNVVQAAVRTNYYQLDSAGMPKPVIAVKFDSRKVDGMPQPRPLYEIFIYSPRVEAVHLRFGKVARGGIRWSDRPQDFRTEVLGLVKAQQVKNAVIVPVGAKGGFVPKRVPPGDREAVQAEAIATYKTFMSTLLDITDNLGAQGIVPPDNVVRHDGDDPYLVVAADKGTATFSDIANGIAQEHGYWLDDAFASGGSAGYDHKKMGITARGAWESVKRHFREMDIDIGTTPFTVAGVGDMSGDVFGNGMLREPTIRLVAAFDHRDIFIDPDPDPVKSFGERQRLFNLPRSSWQDYDKALISAGGGVYSRLLKEIPLSAPAQASLGFAKPTATPHEVMNAILRAPVDLLFFGGIGTYVRAASESNEAAGDRANDPIRTTGAELRCKVVGEGANLGVTQRGRIEAALHGVRLNSDAIDNSAGVNTSDVEVNLKIALSRPLRDGRLARDERNTLLAGLTDEVARLVLRNNYQQTLALSLAQRRGLEDLGFQQRLMQTLERRGLLDRAVEFLPDDMEIAERRRRSQPLTRPELAVLLAYAKLWLHDDLLQSPVPDDPYLGRELLRYFPPAIAARFPDALEHHRLRRDIIATQLANSMINRGGPTLVVRIADQTGAAPDRIAAAFAAVRESYGLITLNTAIEGLDNRIPGETQLGLFAAVQNLLLDRIVWFLRHVDLGEGLAAVADHYRAGIAEVAASLDRALADPARNERAQRAGALAAAGVPQELAQQIADLPYVAAGSDIMLTADRTGKTVPAVAATYFAAVAFFQLDRIAAAAHGIVVADYFDRLALDRALDTIGAAERRLVADMMGNGAVGADAVAQWVKMRDEVARVRMAVHEIAASGLTVSKLSVAANMLGDLVR